MRLTTAQKNVVAGISQGAGLRAQTRYPFGAYWTADFETVGRTTLDALRRYNLITVWIDDAGCRWVLLSDEGRALAEKLREEG